MNEERSIAVVKGVGVQIVIIVLMTPMDAATNAGTHRHKNVLQNESEQLECSFVVEFNINPKINVDYEVHVH